MILTFGPNPALERVALVEKFQAAEAQKPMRVSTHAGGPSLRAANVARLLGGDVIALGFVGGHLGALLRDCLDQQDIPHVLTPIQDETRGDFLLLDRESGVITEIPETPPAFTDAEADKLLASLERHLGTARCLIVADRQDSEAAAHLIARAAAKARDAGVRVIADLGGAPLGAVIAERGAAWLVRVNLKTLQKRTERSLQHDSAIFAEAHALRERGVGAVCVTLGEEGALLVDDAGQEWRIKPPIVSHFNPTGCGETLVGAVAAHLQKSGADGSLVEAVRYGCAAASVNVTHDEPGYATPGEVNILLPKTRAQRVTPR